MDAYPSLKHRLASLLEGQSATDVTFLVGNGKFPVKVHALVLSTASLAFKNMLYGEFNGERTIEVPDGTPDGFWALLRYVYTDEAQLTLENVASTMYLSNKYFVTGLYRDCIAFVKANVCGFLEHAELFDDLKKVCDGVLRHSGAEVLKSEGFLHLSKDAMSAMIARNDLAANETLTYERAVEWAKRQLEIAERDASPSSIRAVLGDALFLIRFPLMDVKEFAAGPAESGILTDKECVALYGWFTLGKKPTSFCTEPRDAPTASLDEIRQHLGLRKMYDCAHADQVCLNAGAVISACNTAKDGCAHLDNGTAWICLCCLKTACGFGDACGMRKHTEEEQHCFFVSKQLHSIYCTSCQRRVAQE